MVGAGPVGSQAARLFAEQGFQVLMVEEHPEVGHPVQCAGLVTPRIFDHVPFDASEVHQNDLHGGIIVSPNGTELRFRTDKVQAQAMDRAGFDQRMAKAAEAAGVDVLTGTKAVAVTSNEDGHIVTLQGQVDGPVHCRFLVGADGIRSRVATWFNLPKTKEIVSAYEVELHGCTIPDGEEDMIPMFAGKSAAPGFFSWVIPIGKGATRSGLAVAPGLKEEAAKVYYERMFDDPRSAKFLAGSTEGYRIIGGIPLGLRKRLVGPRVAVVGDAAGMAKPTSGGGIYMGLEAAEALVEAVTPALRSEKGWTQALSRYERQVRKTIGKELRIGNLLRTLFRRMRDEDLDRLAELLADPEMQAIIEEKGDIDFPSRLVLPLVAKQPRLATLFAKVLIQGEPRKA